jgi:hypothetical protein
MRWVWEWGWSRESEKERKWVIYTISDDNACLQLLLSDYSALGGGALISMPFLNMNEWMSATTNRARLVCCCSMLNSLHNPPSPGAQFFCVSLITTNQCLNGWMGPPRVAHVIRRCRKKRNNLWPRSIPERVAPQRTPLDDSVSTDDNDTLTTKTKTTRPIWPTAFGGPIGIEYWLMMMTTMTIESRVDATPIA